MSLILRTLLISFIVLFGYSCNVTVNIAPKNPCPNLICQNQGIANKCKCKCPPGYGGEFCEKFLTCDVMAPLCPTNSTCEVINGEAACFCNNGYSGIACNEIIRAHYTIGNSIYQGTQKCTINSIPCEVILLNGNNIDEIKLKNFMPQKPDIEIELKILGMNTFIIPQQTQPSWGFSIKSLPNTSGHMSKVANDTFINIPYEISYPNGQTTICVLDLKKQ